ncbi:hypothetical protein CFC21_062935 [Triticum aestivum]|uniref:TPX2 central domain-containing protein n=2 Tax=Triticum aestivum TaxID=4565 RepID=A0A9R1KII8_WHEAT|nr:hypothetical protein CFC21_062935 [Triticum aestivum]
MEPMDIDWNRVVSRFVLDETYEGIEAPHWADLADPEARTAAVDDDAWFCRPDCKHPKTADDFLGHTPSPKAKLLRSMSAMMPFAERDANLRDANNNLKRRGAVAGGTAAFASPTKPKPPPKKRFQDDAENQDPALTTPPPAAARPPFGAQRWAKNAKEAIKSSAEKRPDVAEKEALLGRNPAPRQLKSTLSARNLFSGKDILGQISDFYNELKQRMAGGGSQQCVSEDMEEMSPRPMKGKKIGLKVEAGKQRSPSVLKEVKATPPTPQRFPSPYVNRVKSVKAAGATSSSPLKKPLKDKVTPNKDQENSRDAKRQPFGVKDMNNNRAYEAEESSSGVFWFLKPCTFLVE